MRICSARGSPTNSSHGCATALPLLELRDVAGVSVSLEEGEVLAVLGNGTAVLRSIAGFEKTHGEIAIDGGRVYRRAPESMARRGVVYLAARGGIFASLSVLENLRLGAWTQRGLSSRDLARLFEVFPALYEVRNAAAGTLSATEQRTLALARALAAKPRVLLADEPSLGLPPAGVAQVFELLRVVSRRGAAVVLADQHERLARSFATRIVE
jgi:branched-chain amino acid transport system ATP-binding protein